MTSPRKNLIYFLLFTNQEKEQGHYDDYLEQLRVSLQSLRAGGDLASFDVLFLADAPRAEQLHALPELKGITHETRVISASADLRAAMCARFLVHAVMGDALQRYEKVLYADVDTVFLRGVSGLFDRVIDPALVYVKPEHRCGTDTENPLFSLGTHPWEEARRFTEEGVEVFNSGQFAWVNGPIMDALFADLAAAVPALVPRSRAGFEQPIFNSFLRSRHLATPCLDQRAFDDLVHLDTEEKARPDRAVIAHFVRSNKLFRMRAELARMRVGLVSAGRDRAAPVSAGGGKIAAAGKHVQRGVVLQASGRIDEAEAAYRAALDLAPDHVAALDDMGSVLQHKLRFAEAVVYHEAALALDAERAMTSYHLACALCALGRPLAAVDHYQRTVALDPKNHQAHLRLGALLIELRKPQEALPHLQRVVELGRAGPDVFCRVGRAFFDLLQLAEAEQAYRSSLTIDPGFVDARIGLAEVLHTLGELDGALMHLRFAVEAEPSAFEARSNLLRKMLYHGGLTPEAIAAEHRITGAAILASKRGEPHPAWRIRDRDPERRLRVAYLSPDYHLHPSASSLELLFAAHDPAAVEVYAYSSAEQEDATTDRLRGLAHQWRHVAGKNDAEVAARIAEDRIDILVDCAGYTPWNRIGVLALKPAPLQGTWLGYPHGTGLSTVDFRLTDAHADPPGMTEAQYVEALVRLPEGAYCLKPYEHAPAPAPGPLEHGEGPVFGCFDNPHKLGPEVIALWAEIINAVPGARLRLKARSFLDATAVTRFQKKFAAAGLAPDRLELLGRRTTVEGWADYQSIDVALDPFPYSGTTTTCEALWMAVPVVTLSGRTSVSRAGVSLLSRVGLGYLVARDHDHYLDLAVGLARDPGLLAAHRRALRGIMAGSALCDGPAFARQVEAAYRALWRARCERERGAPLITADAHG
jgi:protein O-GlcNAc transferase